MVKKLREVKQWHEKIQEVIGVFFGGAIGSGGYRSLDIARIVDDIHNRMYFELMLKNFVLAQRRGLDFKEFKQCQIKAAKNWHFIKINRWPIRVSWKDFTDPYINVMHKCYSYKDVFRLLSTALPDLKIVLSEYAKLKTQLYNAEEEILFWIAQNHEKILSNHRQNTLIEDNKFAKIEDWMRDKELSKKTMDFLMTFRLNYLDSEQDLAVELEKKDWILRNRIILLKEKRKANENRLKSLLKRRKTLKMKYGSKFNLHKDYPLEKFNWWFLKTPKKNKKKETK